MPTDASDQLTALRSASLPELGSVYAWMPLKAHASTVVKVVGVVWILGEYWVDALDLRSADRQVRKPLATWLASTVIMDDDAVRAAEAALSASAARAFDDDPT